MGHRVPLRFFLIEHRVQIKICKAAEYTSPELPLHIIICINAP